MRIGRFEADGQSRIGVFEDGRSGTSPTRSMASRKPSSTPERAEDVDGETFDTDEITYLPPTTTENTVFCAGSTTRPTPRESDIAVPERPLIFMKLHRTLVGHGEPISITRA